MATKGEKLHTGIMVTLLGLGGWVMFRGTKARAAARRADNPPENDAADDEEDPGDFLEWARNAQRLAEISANESWNLDTFTREAIQTGYGPVQDATGTAPFSHYAFDLWNVEKSGSQYWLTWGAQEGDRLVVGLGRYQSMTYALKQISRLRDGRRPTKW